MHYFGMKMKITLEINEMNQMDVLCSPLSAVPTPDACGYDLGSSYSSDDSRLNLNSTKFAYKICLCF